MARFLLVLVLLVLSVSCGQSDTIETVDECYWRLSDAEQQMFKLYTAVGEGKTSLELEQRLEEAWKMSGCSTELPGPGSLYVVKRPVPECR